MRDRYMSNNMYLKVRTRMCFGSIYRFTRSGSGGAALVKFSNSRRKPYNLCVTFILPLRSGKIKVTFLVWFKLCAATRTIKIKHVQYEKEQSKFCHFYFAALERQNKSDNWKFEPKHVLLNLIHVLFITCLKKSVYYAIFNVKSVLFSFIFRSRM